MTVRPIHVFVAAVALTLLNAAKPAVVDDTAYLLFARHLSEQPLSPYGWQLFWFDAPQPAMEVLLPPVLPYWLSLGVRLFGEHLFLLKLWLFPFAWLLCWAVAALLKRFGRVGRSRRERQSEDRLSARVGHPTGWLFLVFVCSPAVLPLFNFMLDIPALALGAAALALFISGTDRQSLWRCAAAGLLAGLATQAKYSMLVMPVVLAAYAILVGRSWRAVGGLVVAGVVALSLFAGWELWLLSVHGESHFLHHLQAKTDGSPKPALVKPMMGQFGGLLCGLALVAGRAAGWPGWVRVSGGAGVVGLLAMVAFVPHRWDTATGTVDLALVGFLACGIGATFTCGMPAFRLLKNERHRDTIFLLAWVAVEVAGMFALSPFPAARRLVGVCLAATVLVAHGLGRLGVRPERWAVGVAVSVGGFLFVVDCWDAFPEKVLTERAAAMAQPDPGETVWYTGHWGFQYYAERHGMRAIEPTTRFRAGDWLVLPDGPPGRPAGVARPDGVRFKVVAELEWNDWLRVRTIPALYGGPMPMTGADGPRLRVLVARVTATSR